MTTAYESRRAVVVARSENRSQSLGSADDITELLVSQTSGERRLIPTAPALTPGICNKIGQQLQEMYGSVLCEPLPDQFSELLSGLEHARPKS
jgi:hypothetical protein